MLRYQKHTPTFCHLHCDFVAERCQSNLQTVYYRNDHTTCLRERKNNVFMKSSFEYDGLSCSVVYRVANVMNNSKH